MPLNWVVWHTEGQGSNIAHNTQFLGGTDIVIFNLYFSKFYIIIIFFHFNKIYGVKSVVIFLAVGFFQDGFYMVNFVVSDFVAVVSFAVIIFFLARGLLNPCHHYQ